MQFPQNIYYPQRGDDWERRKPEDVGVDPDSLNEAIHYAQTVETAWPRKMRLHYTEMEKEESHPEVIGSIKDRAATNGLILRHGYIIAEWGETQRTDMTFIVDTRNNGTIV